MTQPPEKHERISHLSQSMIGQEIPIRIPFIDRAFPDLADKFPRLIAIDDDVALLQFPNGIWIKNVPISRVGESLRGSQSKQINHRNHLQATSPSFEIPPACPVDC